jgi:hypothetical protein
MITSSQWPSRRKKIKNIQPNKIGKKMRKAFLMKKQCVIESQEEEKLHKMQKAEN